MVPRGLDHVHDAVFQFLGHRHFLFSERGTWRVERGAVESAGADKSDSREAHQ